MKAKPLISIIVPIYNVDKYLKDCLDSLVTQTYKNIEVICVNDGSTDTSEVIVDSYTEKDQRFTKLNQANKGLNGARETGASCANGDYIMFVDSDDILAANGVESLLELLLEEGVDIAVGGYVKFSNRKELSINKTMKPSTKSKAPDRDAAMTWLLSANLNNTIIGSGEVLRMTAWAKLYKSEIIKKTDWGFSNYRANEDEFEMIMWFWSAENGVAATTAPVYYYRVNPMSITQKRYYNISPSGIELDKYDFAREWREKVRYYLDTDKYDELIYQGFVWKIQSATVYYANEGILDEHFEPAIAAISSYQRYQDDIYSNKERILTGILESKSWKITAPLRQIASIKLINRIAKVVRKTIKALLHPRRTLLRVKDITIEAMDRRRYKGAWAISDRIEEAADNGILFYEYLSNNHPEVRPHYIISKDSRDYKKLQEKGVRVVAYKSEQHKKLLKYADVEASAFFNFNPFDEVTLARRKPLKRVFLLHGMDQSDISSHYANLGADLYCTVTKTSLDFYRQNKSRVDIRHKNLQLTGMSRYDLLREKRETRTSRPRSKIVIAPTWRRSLLYKPGTVEAQPESYFQKSEYFKNYNQLLSSKELKKISHKYEVVLLPHPELLSRIGEINLPEHVKIKTYQQLGTNGLYDLALDAKLFITDYTSTMFDFAFLGANIVHFTFDEDDFYSSKQELYRSWFSADRDGFGPCIKDIGTLLEYLASEKWTRRQSNIDKIWEQVPENSSELIYRHIKKLLESDNE